MQYQHPPSHLMLGEMAEFNGLFNGGGNTILASSSSSSIVGNTTDTTYGNPLASNSVPDMDLSSSQQQVNSSGKPTYASILGGQNGHNDMTTSMTSQMIPFTNGPAASAAKQILMRKYSTGIDGPPFLNSSLISEISGPDQSAELSINLDDSKVQLMAAAATAAAPSANSTANGAQIIASNLPVSSIDYRLGCKK